METIEVKQTKPPSCLPHQSASFKNPVIAALAQENIVTAVSQNPANLTAPVKQNTDNFQYPLLAIKQQMQQIPTSVKCTNFDTFDNPVQLSENSQPLEQNPVPTKILTGVC